MLIGLLLVFLFGSSSGLVIDIAKPVKQVVEESARAKQIIAFNKEMLKEEAAFTKAVTKTKKQLTKLDSNRLTSIAELEELLADLDKRRTASLEKIVDGRFKITELMTAAEWDQVYSIAAQ